MRRTWILLCLVLFPVAAGSETFTVNRALQSTDPILTHFTQDSFVRAYLARSPEVKARQNTLLNARVNYQNAFTEAFLPSFSVSATADKNYSRPDNIRSWSELRHADSNAQASGTWNLLNSGKDRLTYQNASLSYEIAQIAFDDFIQESVLSAVQIYYDLLLNQKLVKVYQDDLEINRKQYQQDKVLYDNGLKTRSDLLSSETNYRSSQLSLFSAQNDYANALTAFNIALNQPTETEITLDENLDQTLITLPSLEQDLTQALAQRHDVRQRRLQLKQADIEFKQGKLKTLPSLFVDLFGSTGRGLNNHELWGYNYGMAAGISFDLGFLYVDKYRTRQNLARTHENAALNFEQFLRTTRDSVVQTRNALALKMQSMEISDLRLQAATQKFEATQTKYKNGLMSATDLTVAQQAMVSAQIEHARLLTDLEIAKLRYQYAIGQNIFDYSLEDLQ
ncbi:MAG: TolC family protein [Elusimicrobiaceae bacterium]|nr:TolC family protein [Elusimicrobiaceae bacterium]MBP5616862.1 TolC family protein [Elusimicrobiaceae bacterium]